MYVAGLYNETLRDLCFRRKDFKFDELIYEFIMKYCEHNNSCLFFDVLRTVHLSIFILVINQLDAHNLFYSKFYFMPLYVSSTCARNIYRHEIKLIVKQILFMKLVKY